MPTFTVVIQQFPVVETTYISLDISHYYIYKTFSHINVFEKKVKKKLMLKKISDKGEYRWLNRKLISVY